MLIKVENICLKRWIKYAGIYFIFYLYIHDDDSGFIQIARKTILQHMVYYFSMQSEVLYNGK